LHRVHNVFMAHVVLERSGVMPIVGELIAGRVPRSRFLLGRLPALVLYFALVGAHGRTARSN
jgi:hypothetical protein